MSEQAGVVVGIVRELDDEDGQGRVRVEYPWLPGRPLSPWARIAAPLAGSSRGAWFMPEKDDEVLLAFEQNDFDHPYVVGHLWNGVDKPPDTDREHRVIVTPGGHELRFEDTDGEARVVLKTSGGHELELTDSGRSVTLSTGGGLSLALSDQSQSIALTGGGRKIELSGSQVKIA